MNVYAGYTSLKYKLKFKCYITICCGDWELIAGVIDNIVNESHAIYGYLCVVYKCFRQQDTYIYEKMTIYNGCMPFRPHVQFDQFNF